MSDDLAERLGEAVSLWRQERPTERAHTTVDLASLMGWLMDQRSEAVQVATAAHALNKKLINNKSTVRELCRKWIHAGRTGYGAGEYGEAGRKIMTLIDGTVWCGVPMCNGHDAGTAGNPCWIEVRAQLAARRGPVT